MANPSTAHEPSMEEILASIRQIISEDGEGVEAAERQRLRPSRRLLRAGAEPNREAYETVVSRFDAEPEPMPPIEPATDAYATR